jgi:hypothetical protein
MSSKEQCPGMYLCSVRGLFLFRTEISESFKIRMSTCAQFSSAFSACSSEWNERARAKEGSMQQG